MYVKKKKKQAPLIVSSIGFFYPALITLRALKTKQGTEQWVTYWLIFGFQDGQRC